MEIIFWIFFAFKSYHLVIELDGLIHLSKHEYDLERTKYLESSGLTIIRFRNADIKNESIGFQKNSRNCRSFPLGGNKKGGNSMKKLSHFM